MSAPIRVELPSRGAVLEFDAGTPESVISSVIRRDFQRNGSDVAFDLGQDENFDRSMTVDDFKLYEQYMHEKKSSLLSTAAAAAGSVANVIGKGILGLVDARNLNPAVAAGTVAEAGAQGTRQLYGMLAQSEDPNSVFFRFKDWINGTGKPEERLQQWKEAREFARKTEALDRGEQTVTGIPSEYVNNDVKNALSLVADPTLLIPGVGEIMGAGRLASRAFGAGLEAGAKTARLVTAPIAGAVDAASEAALRATGPNAAALRGAAAATGLTGVIMGVPGVREATAVVGGVKLADKVAEIAARAGRNLAEGGSRIGPMEVVGMAPNAGKIDRAVGAIGKYGGDRALDLGLAGGAGALEGSVIGAGLGYLSGGEEGAAAGFGSGAVLGGVAGTGVRAFDTVTGKVAAENRAADFERFLKNSDETTRSNFEAIAERDGLDAAVNTMDIRNLLQGSLKDATFTVLDDAAFQERFGNNARGVQVITAGQPEVVINSSKMASNYTAGHELFHALDAVEQLRPQAERIKQEIVGTFVTQPDGKVVQASEGLLSQAEVEARFNEYKSKAPANAEWDKASTFAEKARLVANELGAEYMGRLISGSNPDEMLRGFSGVTRTLMDMALTRDASSRIRQLAEGLGLGSKPVESIVFKDLQAASPALNGMLRDLVRARRNLSERMELADGRGEVITRNNINSPAVAQKAVEMGVAARNADGTVSMKPDDVLAKEDAAATSALRDVVTTTPVADVTKPHLRVVDGKVTGAGISPEQLSAIQAAPGMSNKVKEALTRFSDSISAQTKPGEGNVLFIEYGAATKRAKSRITGSWKSVYSSGIRVSQREVAPYQVYVSDAGNVVAKVVDISKLRADASDLASKGRLGPYGADLDAFLADSVRYFDNISDPNGVRTRELPGMTPERATFLNQHFGQDEKGGAKFIRDIRLDRVIQIRPTGERIAASELAWQRQKVNWMPEEKLPEGSVISSNEGFRIISKNGKFSLYSPDGQRVGIYDTQAKAEQRANKVADALPRRNVSESPEVSRDDQGNIKFRGKEPKDWTPQDFADYGKAFGVANLGPLSPVKEISTGVAGNPARVPGGLDGKFTYYDLLWLKANPVDVKSLPETTHAQLTAKLARSMAPEIGDKIASFNSIVFGMLSPNAPLLPNEMAQARLRFGSMDELKKFAALYPENPTKENLRKLNDDLKRELGFTAAGKGGLGIPITADLSNVVNAARLFLKNPDFFVKQPGESWANFVDKLTTQVPGFGTKTGSFGSVWQDPLNASISAMDRHMARIFGEELMGDKQLRQRFEGIVVDRFNKLLSDSKKLANRYAKKLVSIADEPARAKLEAQRNKDLRDLPDPSATKAKTIDDVLGQAEIYGPERVREFVNEAVFAAMGSRKAKLLTANGELNPRTPEHLKSVNWIETPQDFQVMSDAYRAGLEINERRADELGIAVFPAQWTLWDRIRQRVEPHEAMFPGLEKLPALNDRQLAQAYAANKVAGYMSTPKPGKKWKRSQVESPSQLAYFMPDAADEYRGQHTAPGRDSAPAHDLIGSGVYPKDVYQRPDWYEQGDGLAVMRRVLALKDRPDAKVAIYRAIPTEVYKREMAAAEKSGEPFLNRVIRPGDWVTIDKTYATEHGESALNGDFKVVHKQVPASHIFTNGDSIMEWGYHPDTAKAGQGNFMPAAPSQAISSADTSLQQVPALFKSKAFVPRGTNLDIGAGKFDLGKQYLERERGVTESVPFDPFNRDAETNRLAVERLQSGERFATTTIPNVLNVIAERSVRDNVILQAARALDPQGVAYFQIYEGDRSGDGRQTSKGYQNNKKTSDYIDEVRRHFGEVRISGNVIVASGPKVTERKAFWQLSPEGPSLRFMPDDLVRISANLERAGIKNDVSENSGLIRIHRMVVPADKRNQGLGSGAMQQLVNYADQTGKRIALSPSTDFGSSSVSRLKDFYRRFGFVDNKGRDQDLAVSETMIREPKPQVNFMPEAMPNGTVYRSSVGYNVVNKNGGKFRVYSPAGILVAVANSLEEAQRMIERKAK